MIPYILNAGLILMGCLAFYKLLLQKETFYRLNRYILVLCLLVAFSLPLLHVPRQLSFRQTTTFTINTGKDISTNSNGLDTVTSADKTVQPQAATQDKSTVHGNTFSWQQFMQWMFWLYWFGVIVFALNFLLQTAILFYRAYTNPVIKDGRFRIVEVKGDKAPCSFLNNIFINPEKYDWDVYNQVLQHEKIHIQQRHSLDILLAEVVLIFQWFNPFAWQYRKEIENNLEFLTDNQLVQKEHVEKSRYQMSLLKVSAPHFPLSLTTNYNQSLLKKRIAMMNTKRSSVHTAWKYFFLLPLFVLFASLLNEPVATAQNTTTVKNEKHKSLVLNNIKTEGYWFATIKDDRIKFRFTQDESDHDNYNGSDFLLSEFPNLPKETKGDFKLIREAGTMNFNGKFDGTQGMGRYKFVPDATFGNYMSVQGIDKLDDEDLMTFFFVNVTKAYVQMLKDEGFTNIKKDNLVALCALKVDKQFISSIKEHGYKDVELEQFTALKALGVDGAYIKEIKDAGYKDITLEQLISFKVQGIDKAYLAKLPKTNKPDAMSADNVVSLKAMNVDEAYANSFKAIGYKDIEPEELISMKALGITPEFVQQFQSLGYKNISTDNLVAMKAQGITAEFIKSFENAGYKNVKIDDLISVKALGVQPEYIQSFKDKGYDNISLDEAVSLKSQNITPEFLNEFAAIGYKDVSLDNAVALKATGVTADWIKEMKAKGFNYSDVSKYIALKSLQ